MHALRSDLVPLVAPDWPLGSPEQGPSIPVLGPGAWPPPAVLHVVVGPWGRPRKCCLELLPRLLVLLQILFVDRAHSSGPTLGGLSCPLLSVSAPSRSLSATALPGLCLLPQTVLGPQWDNDHLRLGSPHTQSRGVTPEEQGGRGAERVLEMNTRRVGSWRYI